MKHDADNPTRVLVIGWGNNLRSDDGAGRAFADAVASLALTGVETLSVHQLTPELAAQLGDVDVVVFADACPVGECGGLSIRTIRMRSTEENPATSAIGHVASPQDVLRLARDLYGAAPDAWLVVIPAHSFDAGERLSAETARAVQQGVRQVEIVIRNTKGKRHEYAR